MLLLVWGLISSNRETLENKYENVRIELMPRLIHRRTATTRPLPIERALKTDLVTILAVYQLYYSNTNQKGNRVSSLEGRKDSFATADFGFFKNASYSIF